MPMSSRRALRWFFTVLVLSIYGLGALGLGAYFSFYYPIKTDRYKHWFTEHMGDRLIAYWLLFESGSRIKNTKRPIEEIHPIVTATSTKLGVEACLIQAVILYEFGPEPEYHFDNRGDGSNGPSTCHGHSIVGHGSI